MHKAALVFVVLLYANARTEAAFTDFSDYAQSTEFSLNDVFSSEEVSFRAVSILPMTNPVQVIVDAAGAYSFLAPGPGAEVLLPAGTREVSFAYEGGGARIAVNGVQPIHPGQNGTPFQAASSTAHRWLALT